MSYIKGLTDERTKDKRRITELIQETNDKDRNIQVLHAQLNSIQHPQQQQIQSYQVEFQRLRDENTQLKQHLSQQHFQQQQQVAPMNILPTNNESSDVQFRVLSEQVKKLSVDNGNLEKQLKARETAFRDFQKEKRGFNSVKKFFSFKKK